MNTNVAKILKSTAPEVQTDALDIVAQFCSASLLAPPLCIATLGFDVSGGIS
jgi:hypothetical protein